ncbi:MAG TPA: hypothetical protein VHN14_15990 [Kofleriaceae bacterium]|nr:hypothetical protein [Kofleriaceae bacterium]
MYSQASRKFLGPMIAALSLLPMWKSVAEAQDGSVSLIAPPPAPPPGQWLLCAVEGGECHIQGRQMVRYGVEGHWVYGSTTTPLHCSNATFGDPSPGTRKSCYFLEPRPVAPPWTRCGVEGGNCNILHRELVRYGTAGAWVYGIFNSTFSCTNANFGDPKVGVRKECYYHAPPPQGPWRVCAVEGGRCNFVGRAYVRYGTTDNWVYGAAVGGIACNNATFGDPRVGTVKRCYFTR